MHNQSYENEFNLHVNEISISYEKMSTKTRFEEEAKGNSEMAYFTEQPHNDDFKWVIRPIELTGEEFCSLFQSKLKYLYRLQVFLKVLVSL